MLEICKTSADSTKKLDFNHHPRLLRLGYLKVTLLERLGTFEDIMVKTSIGF
jgi:hypothetical protein